MSEVGKTHIENEKTVETTYKKQIQAQQTYLKDAKERNTEAVKNNDETQKKLTQTTMDETNRRLDTLVEELRLKTSIVGENSPDVVDAWKQLATDSYEVYEEKVSHMPLMLQIVIEEMTGVAVENAPEFATVMEGLAQMGVDALDKNEEIRAQALASLNSYLAGLTDEEKRKLLQQAGIENVDLVMQELQNGDVSEENGVNILKGLNKGLNNKEFKNNLFGTAASISGQLANLFTIQANISSAGIRAVKNALPGHKTGLDYVPYDNYVARLHKGERVLTAEENKQYMSDNIENKIASNSIVVQFFPQSMTEAEIDKAERHIRKKWGLAI